MWSLSRSHSFKQTTGQKPGSIWAHEDCKTFGAEWKKTPVSSARRFQLSCTCAKCFSVPHTPFSWRGARSRGEASFLRAYATGIEKLVTTIRHSHFLPGPLSEGKMRTSSQSWYWHSERLSLLDIHSSYHTSQWVLKTTPHQPQATPCSLSETSFLNSQLNHPCPSQTLNCQLFQGNNLHIETVCNMQKYVWKKVYVS